MRILKRKYLRLNHPFPSNKFTSSRATSGLMLNSSLIIASSFFKFSFCVSAIHWQSSAVSGLGISTPGSTWKVRPAKSACPSTYCTGSPFCSLVIISSSFLPSSADNSLTLSPIMSVSVIPYFTSSTVRTIACASPASYRGVRDCQSC